jgi:hypothetical protein
MAGSPQAGGAFLPNYDVNLTGQVQIIPSVAANTPVISTIKGAFSTADVSAGYAADTYLAGSSIAAPSTGFLAGTRYSCTFDMVKTAAGTATPTVIIRIGTAGAIGDAAICTFTFAAGTAAVDTGTFVVTAHFRTVGGGTVAVVSGTCECRHALAATGLVSTGASGQGQIQVTSSGFDSTPAGSFIGISFNGGASFSGTNKVVEAELRSY